jgi:predicted nucleic acid-binding protein
VILIDANILIYACNEDSVQHGQARTWLDEQLNGPTRVGLPWASLLAFLRLTTNRRVFSLALTIEDAGRFHSGLGANRFGYRRRQSDMPTCLGNCWRHREFTAIWCLTPISRH